RERRAAGVLDPRRGGGRVERREQGAGERYRRGPDVELPLDGLHLLIMENDAPRITAGSVVHHYEVIRPLGRGGMGMVFLARDPRLGRLVAIKLLTEHSGEHAQRFLIEARATAQLSHENIVIIHELGEYGGAPYMVLEYLKGKTLQQILRE